MRKIKRKKFSHARPFQARQFAFRFSVWPGFRFSACGSTNHLPSILCLAFSKPISKPNHLAQQVIGFPHPIAS